MKTPCVTLSVHRNTNLVGCPYVGEVDGLPAVDSGPYRDEEGAARGAARMFGARFGVQAVPYSPRKIVPGVWALNFFKPPIRRRAA